jgi:hypothetical protein
LHIIAAIMDIGFLNLVRNSMRMPGVLYRAG